MLLGASMAWCETNRVDFLFGLARNARLADKIEAEMAQARVEAEISGKPARRFRDFSALCRHLIPGPNT